MFKHTLNLLFYSIIIIFSGCSNQQIADLLFVNGKIFTARNSSDFVEALAIKHNKILAAGKTVEVEAYRGADTRVIDLNGNLILPGFHDAHLHFWNGAYIEELVDLRGVRSRETALQLIRTAVEKAKPGEWIIGRGWDHELWPGKQLPDRRALDRIAPDNPVYLKRVDGHAAWVNSVVLNMLGYNSGTEDPPGGKIVRYNYSGRPTGILVDKAYEVLDNLVPEPTSFEKEGMVKRALAKANRFGLTGITDNSGSDLYSAYADLFDQDQLTLRVHFWTDFPEDLDSLRHYYDRFTVNDSFLNANLIKLYADGSLGSRSAYLLEPYLDDPENRGLPQLRYEELLARVREVDDAGWRVGIHAIGDAANRTVLDIYQQIDPGRARQHRWRVEHAQIVHPDDVARFAKMGIIASMQPTHCISDMKWAENRIGERVEYAYSWRSMLRNDVHLAFGTDWPVEPLNPLVGIYAAVTRKDTTGFPDEGWTPEQKLTVGEAVYAYTFGSAYAAKTERWQGRLMPGYVADLIILDKDIFEVQPGEILDTRVLATYLDGRLIYSADQ